MQDDKEEVQEHRAVLRLPPEEQPARGHRMRRLQVPNIQHFRLRCRRNNCQPWSR